MHVFTNSFFSENTTKKNDFYTKQGFLKVYSLCCGYYESCKIDNFHIKLHAYSANSYEVSVINHTCSLRYFKHFTTIKQARLYFIKTINKYYPNLKIINNQKFNQYNN